jgi:RNA-binding protein
MNSSDRAKLRSAANAIKACYYIGKDGITDAVLDGIEEALVSRELIKIGVQENCPVPAKEACTSVAESLDAEPVQVIGRKFVIYRRNKEINQYGI